MRRIVIEIRSKQDRPILIVSAKRGRLLSVSGGEFGTFLIVLYLKSMGIIRTTDGTWIRRDLEMLFFHATYISICRQEGHVGYTTHHDSLPSWQELTTSAWCYYQLRLKNSLHFRFPESLIYIWLCLETTLLLIMQALYLQQYICLSIQIVEFYRHFNPNDLTIKHDFHYWHEFISAYSYTIYQQTDERIQTQWWQLLEIISPVPGEGRRMVMSIELYKVS